MCGICDTDQSITQFVFPKKNEDLHQWFHRVQEIEHMHLVMMHQSPDNLAKIDESYRLQGFMAHNIPDVLNVLIIRDLIFVTYTDAFAELNGWTDDDDDVA